MSTADPPEEQTNDEDVVPDLDHILDTIPGLREQLRASMERPSAGLPAPRRSRQAGSDTT